MMIRALLLAVAVAVPTATGYVTDPGGVLSATERRRLEATLRAYEQRTTREIAVLVAPSLNGMPLEEYANRVFHAWGIGNAARDNGVLILWVPATRQVRIEVGYGLEPLLPDGRAGQILRERILPRFRAAQWAAGLDDGVAAIITQLDQQPEPASAPAPSVNGWWLLAWVGVGGVLIGVIARYRGAQARARRQREWQEERRAAAYRAQARPPQTGAVPPMVSRVTSPPAVPRRTPMTDRAPVTSSTSSRADDDSPAPSRDWGGGASSGGSDFGGFGGGDSGGGGASGDY